MKKTPSVQFLTVPLKSGEFKFQILELQSGTFVLKDRQTSLELLDTLAQCVTEDPIAKVNKRLSIKTKRRVSDILLAENSVQIIPRILHTKHWSGLKENPESKDTTLAEISTKKKLKPDLPSFKKSLNPKNDKKSGLKPDSRRKEPSVDSNPDFNSSKALRVPGGSNKFQSCQNFIEKSPNPRNLISPSGKSGKKLETDNSPDQSKIEIIKSGIALLMEHESRSASKQKPKLEAPEPHKPIPIPKKPTPDALLKEIYTTPLLKKLMAQNDQRARTHLSKNKKDPDCDDPKNTIFDDLSLFNKTHWKTDLYQHPNTGEDSPENIEIINSQNYRKNLGQEIFNENSEIPPSPMNHCKDSKKNNRRQKLQEQPTDIPNSAETFDIG
jgi:hypothetical protein